MHDKGFSPLASHLAALRPGSQNCAPVALSTSSVAFSMSCHGLPTSAMVHEKHYPSAKGGMNPCYIGGALALRVQQPFDLQPDDPI